MKKETRTYKISGEPQLLDKFERLLSMMHYASSWGHSGIFGMWLDGDGADRLNVSPVRTQARKGVEKIGCVGYHVELATDRGFSGTFIDWERKKKWNYKENGTADHKEE